MPDLARATPIVDCRGDVDQPQGEPRTTHRFHSFSVRPRLLRQNDNYNYQVMRIEEGRAGATVRVIDATLRSMML